MKFRSLSLFVFLGVFSAGANATFMGGHHGGCGGGWQDDDPVCTDEWTDSWEGSDVLLSSSGTQYWEYTFDITDDGFVVGEDTVYDYELTFGFRDDAWDGREYVKVYQAGEKTSYWEVDTGTDSADGIIEGISQLNDSGELFVKLKVKYGDFFLTDADLYACGLDYTPPPTTDVPEPATVALFGLGLLGMGIARKRQIKNNG